jgi:biopolymer transport protein ExbD
MVKNYPLSRLRLVMDIFLVLAVIIALTAYLRPSTASAQLPTQSQAASSQDSPGLSMQDQPVALALDTDVITGTVILDNETLAAVIAAENAALTQPQYVITLPVIIR